ncbi:YolD-like family protein [Brevibacillus sp. 7WMA2]|nr:MULTISPECIES: YolD-like family protein [Brevibacillus]MCR8995586.1 YolD-like family protein [Brevibacillus laterosporus]QIC05730.1 YolD-like family protein [Brevibacillus sp. 7WMA2]RJL15791.1 YolD-like family protein [Brevibacillus laterosporus]TPH06527.1 YolD-like family protein [Brevibacillus laterosporus]
MKNKPVSKKENLFATSRFILPEHRELYLRMKAEQERYCPPNLDEEDRASISATLFQGLQQKRLLTLRYYDDTGEKCMIGHALHVDPVSQRLKLQTKHGVSWISCQTILAAEVEDSW